MTTDKEIPNAETADESSDVSADESSEASTKDEAKAKEETVGKEDLSSNESAEAKAKEETSAEVKEEAKEKVAAETKRVIDQVARQQLSDKAKEGSGERIQLIIFRLGTEEYALHIDQIKEVVLTPNIAKIPQTPEYIRGVANIRGNVIAILDLEKKFDIVSEDVENNGEASNYTLVVESEKFKIGILVKEVPNTLAVNTSEIDSSSSIVQYSTLDENCINGIVKSGDRMIIMMDMFKMMEAEELSSLSKSIE